MKSDLENLINYLRKVKLIPVNDMVEKLGLDSRHDIYNIRRTSTEGRKKALYDKIFEIYKTELADYDESQLSKPDTEIKDKYLKLLENQNAIIEEQYKLLKKERDLLEATLLEKIRILEDRLKKLNH